MVRIELRSRRLITAGIALAAAVFHFAKGENHQGPFPIFVNSWRKELTHDAD